MAADHIFHAAVTMRQSVALHAQAASRTATARAPLPPLCSLNSAREPNDDNNWLITLSDLTLLLICFLALWYVKHQTQTAPVQPPPPAALAMAEQNAAAAADREIAAATEWRALEDEIQNFIKNSGLSENLTLEATPNEILLSLKDTIPFASGKAELRPPALPILRKVAEIALRRPGLDLEINGHTDDRPIATAEFPSNWELSTARASRVARYLVERGVHPSRLAVQGYANHRPRAVNSSAASRGANRRVEISLHREIETKLSR